MFAEAMRIERHGPDPLRRRCASCVHSEFVHEDGRPRGCLFSDCTCRSFTIDLASIEGRDARGHA